MTGGMPGTVSIAGLSAAVVIAAGEIMALDAAMAVKPNKRKIVVP
jgi:hypothetical protein